MNKKLMVHRSLDTDQYEVYVVEKKFELTPEQAEVIAGLFDMDADLISMIHIHGPQVTIIHAFTAEDN